MERIVKGFANHRRLQVLELLNKEPELSVQEISEKLKSEFKNISTETIQYFDKQMKASLSKKFLSN